MKTLRPDVDLSSREHLQGELDHLRAHMREAEDTLRAIHEGEVDALVVSEREGEKIYILRSPDRTYRLMIEEMRQGAVTVTPDGTILYANGCFAEILRISAQSLVGARVGSFVARNSLDLLEALLGQQGKAQGEVELVAGDGTRVPVFVAVSQLSLEQEQPVLCLVVTDLTDQKRNEKLVADEELARSVLDHAAEAMVVCDTEGRIVRANREAHRLCGRNVLLERFEEAFPLEMVPGSIPGIAEAPATAGAFVARVLAGEQLRGVEAGLDGGRLDLMLSAGPLRPAGRKTIEGCVVTLTDITERRRSERELESAWAAAEAMNQAKDHFLATLSHELRTPLTPVLAIISGLESSDRFPPDLHQNVVMMRRNIELEARLIDDLLDLTRVSRGKLELDRRNVNLRELLDHAVQTSCAEELAFGRRQVVVDLQDGDLRLWGDTSRLTQVFWNLLNNAVKFTPEGGTITVRSSFQASGEIAVEISDTGVGIDSDVLPRIFDAFEQGDATVTRRFGGLGLGLAISKAIVELHGGTIGARSSGKDRGTTFEVRLPVGTLQLGAEGLLSREGAPSAPVRVPGKLHILLVEDHLDTAGAIAELLRTRGHVVQIAGTVAQALAAAGEQRFDLVLSDLGLPDGSGQDLMRELSRRYRLRGIALSGYGMEDDIRRSREAGFHCHLTKPVNLQALETAIQQVASDEPAEL